MSVRDFFRYHRSTFIAAVIAVAVLFIWTAPKSNDEMGAGYAPVIGDIDGREFGERLVGPMASKAIVDKDGKCLWVLTAGDYQRACKDQPDWRELPKVVDQGQYHRGTSLD